MANEKRLIEANALKGDFMFLRKMWSGNEIMAAIDEAPIVDAEPVVHGHWVKYNFLGHEQWACSECQTLGSPQWKRCPVCEAKMDGGNEDGVDD